MVKPLCDERPQLFVSPLSPITFLLRGVVAVALGAFVAIGVPHIVAATQSGKMEASAGNPDNSDALEPGKSVEGGLQGGAKHAYEIRAEPGQFLHCIAEQLGIDVVLILYAPDGKRIASADSPNGAYGLEQISTITAAPGAYRLEVVSSDKSAAAGRYRVSVEALRAPVDGDRVRIAAERALFEAEELRAKEDADSRRPSIEKYAASLSLWQNAGDKYEEALMLHMIGTLQKNLGERHKALEYYERALALRQEIGDKDGEARTRSEMGVVFSELGQKEKALEYFRLGLTVFREAGDRGGEEAICTRIAGVYEAQGEKQKALDYYGQTLPLVRAEGKQFAEAATLNNMGLIYGGLGEKQNALDCLNQALSLERAMGNREEEGTTLDNLGLVYISMGENKKALEYFLQALPLIHAAGNRGEEGSTLTDIGMVDKNLGEKNKALDYFAHALLLERAAGNKREEARTLDNIGSAWSDLGQKKKALEYYEQALALERAERDRAAEAISLNDIGAIYFDLGEMQRALDYYNQAMPVHREAGNRIGEANTLNGIGGVHYSLGEKQKALEFYRQALAIQREVQDRAGEANTLNSMGAAYDGLGEKQKALEFYNESLLLNRRVGNRSFEAQALMNIGMLYGTLGEKQKALQYYEQALALERAVGNRNGEALSLDNIGRVYDDLGNRQRALDNYALALPLMRAVNSRDGEAVTLYNFARVYDALGQREKALEYHNKALLLVRAVGDRSGEANTLNNIGRVYDHMGNRQVALDYYNQALVLFRGIDDPLGQGRVLGNLMRLWRKNGEAQAAIFFGKQAVNNYQQVRSNIRGLDKETQESFVNAQGRTYRGLADILISQGRLIEAQQVLELLKKEEYFEFIRRDDRQAASLTGPIPLTKKEEELSRKLEQNSESVTTVGSEWAALRAKPSRTPEEETHLAQLSEQLKLANQSWGKFLNGLHTDLGESSQTQKTVANLEESASGLQRVVRQLGSGAVVLYTLVSDEKYHVILITPTVQVAREYPIKAAELNKKIADFRAVLLDPRTDPVPQAQELYKILVGPIANDLAGAQATTLMWSLDGVLRYLPLAALHDGHEYLVEKYRNVVITPASIPELAARPTVREWRGLGMGVSKSYNGMSALPAVPAELLSIIREAGTQESGGVMPGHTMLDEEFTESNLKNSLSQKYPLVHIASHFVFGSGNDTDSYLLLGGKEVQGQRLTLAEINDDPEISFEDVELLTLSACNTALGMEADGREVDGLGILAQRKGAKAVMATLWSVHDSSTSALMRNFYRDWTSGTAVSKAEALQSAQVGFLHGGGEASEQGTRATYAHPYYWAPFILIGNWQ
jgi:CHAT domain-containing protein/Tfp pilus assembly protein PilF